MTRTQKVMMPVKRGQKRGGEVRGDGGVKFLVQGAIFAL